jgi:hypothetical protein
MTRAIKPVGAALLFCVLLPVACLASPSGLNNIPTADLAPYRVVVLQAWSNFANGADTFYFVGAKAGATRDLEVGLDAKASPDGGPLTAQVKYRLPALPQRPQLALGLANLSTDRDRAGEPMPYVVATQVLAPAARAHLGYSAQKEATGVFLGADFAACPGLLLRADWVRPGSDDALSSLGALWTPPDQLFALEAWASFPAGPPSATVLTLKLDYPFSLATP